MVFTPFATTLNTNHFSWPISSTYICPNFLNQPYLNHFHSHLSLIIIYYFISTYFKVVFFFIRSHCLYPNKYFVTFTHRFVWILLLKIKDEIKCIFKVKKELKKLWCKEKHISATLIDTIFILLVYVSQNET